VVRSILEHTSQHGAIKDKTQTTEVAKKIAEDRYEEFDKKRKIAEAKNADKEDLKELEEIEKRMLENKKGKTNNI